MLSAFLQDVFSPINCFCFILRNTLCNIELFAVYRCLFSNCYLGYCVMERFSIAKRVLIVKTLYKNRGCAMQTVRKLRIIFGRNEAPYKSTIRRLMTELEATFSILTSKLPERKRSCRTEEQLVLVQNSVIMNSRKSIRGHSQQLDIPITSLHRILHKALHMHAYKT